MSFHVLWSKKKRDPGNEVLLCQRQRVSEKNLQLLRSIWQCSLLAAGKRWFKLVQRIKTILSAWLLAGYCFDSKGKVSLLENQLWGWKMMRHWSSVRLSEFFNFTEEKSLHSICALVVLSLRSIIGSAVCENSHHVGDKQLLRAEITTF